MSHCASVPFVRLSCNAEAAESRWEQVQRMVDALELACRDGGYADALGFLCSSLLHVDAGSIGGARGRIPISC